MVSSPSLQVEGKWVRPVGVLVEFLAADHQAAAQATVKVQVLGPVSLAAEVVARDALREA